MKTLRLYQVLLTALLLWQGAIFAVHGDWAHDQAPDQTDCAICMLAAGGSTALTNPATHLPFAAAMQAELPQHAIALVHPQYRRLSARAPPA